ncbi:MAG: hypothetical protein A2086_16095 [Spirochaetes bacterium GWD1_27_9]|nr:MAG: hypothetical protein A2Z98_11720 [Spirochaetes bacterium GWB1_27_13]OHD22612.1 MAG: hypothetical protein A2Y34_07545 [Spirochaetes bacterium GWC1_27_15]OHD37316.1 MAG: hypothetical protein A2086_16095 [Spirochaetes bacterium GWD1_27_9]
MNYGISLDIDFLLNNLWAFDLEIINIENPMYPGYLSDYEKYQKFFKFKDLAKNYKGKFVVDAPYIDLNPGSPEPLNQEITYKRTMQCIEFAKKINAKHIIFLSTFLSNIKIDFYEKGWISNSIKFWDKILNQIDYDIEISLCNTFEEFPDYLLEISQNLNKKLNISFDIGHFLVYGNISLKEWYNKIKDYLSFVILHSNDGEKDLHLSIREGNLLKSDFREIKQDIMNSNTQIILKYFDKTNYKKDLPIIKSF